MSVPCPYRRECILSFRVIRIPSIYRCSPGSGIRHILIPGCNQDVHIAIGEGSVRMVDHRGIIHVEHIQYPLGVQDVDVLVCNQSEQVRIVCGRDDQSCIYISVGYHHLDDTSGIVHTEVKEAVQDIVLGRISMDRYSNLQAHMPWLTAL